MFLVDTYMASTLNTCQHLNLPKMHGPPLEFNLKEEVCPTTVHTPATVLRLHDYQLSQLNDFLVG